MLFPTVTFAVFFLVVLPLSWLLMPKQPWWRLFIIVARLEREDSLEVEICKASIQRNHGFAQHDGACTDFGIVHVQALFVLACHVLGRLCPVAGECLPIGG